MDDDERADDPAGEGGVGSGGGTDQAPAGWYPVGDGSQRYWDGEQWTQHVAPAAPVAGPPARTTSDDTTLALLCHVLGLVSGFIGPLVIYLAKRDQPFVRHHAAEALNFQITVFIAMIGAVIAIFVLIGLLLIPIIAIGALILQIVAAVAASRGEWYRYPVNIRLVT